MRLLRGSGAVGPALDVLLDEAIGAESPRSTSVSFRTPRHPTPDSRHARNFPAKTSHSWALAPMFSVDSTRVPFYFTATCSCYRSQVFYPAVETSAPAQPPAAGILRLRHARDGRATQVSSPAIRPLLPHLRHSPRLAGLHVSPGPRPATAGQRLLAAAATAESSGGGRAAAAVGSGGGTAAVAAAAAAAAATSASTARCGSAEPPSLGSAVPHTRTPAPPRCRLSSGHARRLYFRAICPVFYRRRGRRIDQFSSKNRQNFLRGAPPRTPPGLPPRTPPGAPPQTPLGLRPRPRHKPLFP